MMKRKISVFIAAPGDLSRERKIFRDTIDSLNKGFGDGANISIDALGWEDTLASTGRRSQGIINDDVDKCDVFILVMHRRWGQAAPDAAPFSSYTEEEFHRALERFKKEGSPEILVFFKRTDPFSEADPGPQLKKVIDFRRQLEDTRQVLYHYFDDDISFANEIDRHIRAFIKGELPSISKENENVVLPLEALKEIQKMKGELEKAKAELIKTQKAKESNSVKKGPLKKIFVSYSHQDKIWLDDIKIMLKPIVRNNKLDLWDDSKLNAGSLWREEITKAINESQVAVLLVSKHFLKSDFIAKNELPPLLKAAQERGLTVLWVYVGYCLWHYTEIREYQAAHAITEPLYGLIEHEKDRVLIEICEEILRASNADFNLTS